MKTIAAMVLAAVLGAGSASAREKHEHEHPPGPGLFGQPPEHVHVQINPIPVHGLGIGALALAAALFARSRAARVLALSIVVVAAATTWPVQYFGENAYQNVRKITDEQGQQWLDEHMERAGRFLFLFYGTALLGIAALLSQKKCPKTATSLSIVTLIASIASASVGGWISRAGGQVRHPEFRHGHAASKEAAPHEDGAGKRSHQTMQHEKGQPPDPHAGHKPGAAPEKDAERAPLPDTLEGAWKAIHEHHGELEAAVNGNKFYEVRSHARHLGELAKRLVELSHADHKLAVESGVNKVNQAVAELKQSAETGSELVLKQNFDAFAKSLNDLEQQMKKQ